VKVVRNPIYRITTTAMNLTKSLVISFKHGIRVPKYGCKLRSEQMRGTKKSASKERISKAISIVASLSWTNPTIPREYCQYLGYHKGANLRVIIKAIPTPIIVKSQELQKSA